MSATTAFPTVAIPSRVSSAVVARQRLSTWPLYTTLFASVCIVVGLVWDISWHRTVGRDTFWTYPHVLEQLAAIVSGIGCGWLVLQTTFARSAAAEEARGESVKVWGFRGPLGAWVCIWGTVMMITSAPFDNWWHSAYGLDVKIISPPHMVLAAGMIAIELGALLVALAAQNRSTSPSREGLQMPFAFGAGMLMCMLATVILEQAGFAHEMHVSFFYKVTAWIFPLPLIAFARASSLRWPATTIAAVYMGIILIMLWVLPLFAATPMLAPIYNPVTHMVPPPFPYLLIVPAFVIDLLMHRLGEKRDWSTAIVLGGAFLLVFFAVQWPFADFMLTPHARNAFFAADSWDYNIRPGLWQHTFWAIDRDANGIFSPTKLALGLALATAYAMISARLGLWLGTAMRRIKR
jgi:hypothetical protein